MSSSVRITRRFSRLLCSKSTQLSAASITPISCHQPQWRQRSYVSVRVPKTQRIDTTDYDMQDIPFQEFENTINGAQDLFQHRSSAQYYECAVKFSEAVSKGSFPYNVNLKDKGFSAATMHETGCIIFSLKDSKSFAIALWASASEMGYIPATLSLARQLIGGKGWGKVAALKRVEERFGRMVAAGSDPNALTVGGEHLVLQGKYTAALNMLQKALKVGEPDFEWKPYCQASLATAYLKLGREAEAKKTLETLRESTPILAEAELGMLVRSSDPDLAMQYLYNAALHYKPEMFSILAEICLDKAGLAESEEVQDEQFRWAAEWSRLADKHAES